jgi:hypothetical protein
MTAGWPRTGIVSLGMAIWVAMSSGCCTLHDGSCGLGGLSALVHPPAWYGDCNECGPAPVVACGEPCAPGGLFPWLRRQLTCGHGCGEVYLGEWISDPPDCVDPCDTCYGQWTGPGGVCRLGPFQRILAGLHGYRYCPPPYCGPWCPIFPRHGWGRGGPALACADCQGAGCAACGGPLASAPLHGADIYYQGPVAPPAPLEDEEQPLPPSGTSILDENWEIPRSRPEPGKPIHEARPPARPSLGGRAPAQMSHFVNAPHGRRTEVRGAAVGSGVRPAAWSR